MARKLAQWRRNLGYYWFTRETGTLVFPLVLALPVGLLALMAYFAYSEHSRAADEQKRLTDIGCLSRNIFHEARGEPLAGQRAVAEVTLNRVASRHFPNTVCEVVYEQRWDRRRERYVGAFSWTELEKTAEPTGVSWERARAAAESVYDRESEPIVQGALFYHAVTIEPRWASSKKQVARIGRHIFYE